jgi:hypothetical protein
MSGVSTWRGAAHVEPIRKEGLIASVFSGQFLRAPVQAGIRIFQALCSLCAKPAALLLAEP